MDSLNYETLLSDPNFLKTLQDKGFAKKEEKVYEGKVTFYDNVERTLNWNFQTVMFLHYLMASAEIEELEPKKNLNHFMILVYSMMFEDMVVNNLPSEKFIKFEDFVKIFPMKMEEVSELASMLNFIFIKNKDCSMQVV